MIYYPSTYTLNLEEGVAYQSIESVQEDVTFLVASGTDFEAQKHRFPHLKVLQLPSAGYDVIDFAYLKAHDITLLNAKGIYSEGIAQYIVSYLLYVYQDIAAQLSVTGWDKLKTARSLQDKTVLILGTGDIASLTAKRLKAFDTHIIGVNSNGRAILGFDETVSLLEADPSKADIIISTLPSNDATKHFINQAFLSQCKADALLINIGRGDTIDEQALKAALDTVFSTVILDVFETEPLPKDAWFYSHPKVIVTPHVSFYSEFNNDRITALFESNIRNFKSKQPLENIVK